MGKNNNIIEINGKKYDTATGKQLGHSAASHAPRPKARNIDGVVGGAKHATKTAKAPVTVLTPKAARPAHKAHAARAPQPAKTLMRTSVAKPKDSFKRHVKAQSPAALAKQPHAALTTKPSVTRLDEQRLKHAKHIPQSQLISRFGAPVASTTPALAPPQPVTPLPVIPSAAVPRTATIAAPRHPRTTADVLQKALEHANSHNQPEVHPKKRRFSRAKQITGISAAALSLLVIVGVIGSQNIDNVRLHMASAKAGFTAEVPPNRPAGYNLNKLDYSQGTVSLNFQSNSDNRTYNIMERTSNLDSAGLRDTFVSQQSKNYQTVSAAGRTIYLYGDGNATWVSNNIWYQVSGVGALTNQQLVDLASSL